MATVSNTEESSTEENMQDGKLVLGMFLYDVVRVNLDVGLVTFDQQW